MPAWMVLVAYLGLCFVVASWLIVSLRIIAWLLKRADETERRLLALSERPAAQHVAAMETAGQARDNQGATQPPRVSSRVFAQ